MVILCSVHKQWLLFNVVQCLIELLYVYTSCSFPYEKYHARKNSGMKKIMKFPWVHNFMHGIVIHENFWPKFSFSCVAISFSCMEFSYPCMKLSCHDFLMHEPFRTGYDQVIQALKTHTIIQSLLTGNVISMFSTVVP